MTDGVSAVDRGALDASQQTTKDTPSSKSPPLAAKAAGEIIYLINHIAREGKSVDESVYETALTTSKKVSSGTASTAEEAQFWKAYSALINEASPARVEALHYRDFLEEDESAISSTENVIGMRRHKQIMGAIRWISVASFFVCLVFLAYLSIAESAIQRSQLLADEHSNLVVYIAKGTAVEKAFNSIAQGDYLWTGGGDGPATKPGGAAEGAPRPPTLDAKAREDDKREQQRNVIDTRRLEIESLVGFNDRLLRRLQFNISDSIKSEGTAATQPVVQVSPMDAATLSVQQSINSLISRYLLPVFASLLGVTVFILRNESDDLRTLSLRTFESSTYSNRLALGVVGGLAISWFAITDTSGVIGSISPAALAFLVGYSVEVLYNVLDALVQALGAGKK